MSTSRGGNRARDTKGLAKPIVGAYSATARDCVALVDDGFLVQGGGRTTRYQHGDDA